MQFVADPTAGATLAVFLGPHVTGASLNRTESDREIRASAEIFHWLAEEATRRDSLYHKPWILLMDGQISLWEEAERAFADKPCIEILDLLHVTAYLWEAVHLFHRAGSAEALELMKLAVLATLKGEIESLICWFKHFLVPRFELSNKARERLDKVCNHFSNNQHRMRYHEYLAAGYPIASGIVEGACRHVVKDRMERSAMHCTVAGAQAMLNLGTIAINGMWDNFTQYRIQKENERLYPNAAILGEKPWPLGLVS